MNPDTQNPQAKANILLVEDHDDTLFFFARLFSMHGYTVNTADGYQTALEAAKRERFDVAVCDIALWDGDGCDLLKELLKLQALKAIAVTAFTLAEEVEQYRDAGFAEVLAKPLDPSLIIAAISRLTSSQTIERPIDLRPLDQLTEELGRSWNDFFTS